MSARFLSRSSPIHQDLYTHCGENYMNHYNSYYCCKGGNVGVHALRKVQCCAAWTETGVVGSHSVLKRTDRINLPSHPFCSEERDPLDSYKVERKLQLLIQFLNENLKCKFKQRTTMPPTVVMRFSSKQSNIFQWFRSVCYLNWDALSLCVSLAFICHHNSFLIYGSLEQPTLANWSRVTHVSVGSALIISAAFAVAGYSTFTGYTQGISTRDIELHASNLFLISQMYFLIILYFPFLGDIFENYCRNDNLATFGRFCFGLSIITTFPLECFVTREVSDTFPYANQRI